MAHLKLLLSAVLYSTRKTGYQVAEGMYARLKVEGFCTVPSGTQHCMTNSSLQDTARFFGTSDPLQIITPTASTQL
ncbi:hypothetical protein M3J09_006650 [Ascochyta lentis]